MRAFGSRPQARFQRRERSDTLKQHENSKIMTTPIITIDAPGLNDQARLILREAIAPSAAPRALVRLFGGLTNVEADRSEREHSRVDRNPRTMLIHLSGGRLL